MSKKCVVLSSGGMDSTVCTAYAVDKYGAENVVTATLYYGQKHDRELLSARKIAEYYNLKHIEEDISCVMKYAGDVCSLVKGSKDEIIDKSYAEQIAENGEGRVGTYVPNRNMTLLSIATAYADSLFPGEEAVVMFGAHADDAAGRAYADCSEEFAEYVDKTINIATYGKIHVERPLINLTKSSVCKMGLELKAPFHLTTSCYHGGDEACACCGTCQDRIAAFRANGVIDPIPYAKPIDWTGCKKIDYLADKYVD